MMKINSLKLKRIFLCTLCMTLFSFGPATTSSAEASLCSRLYNLLHFNRCRSCEPISQRACPCSTLPYTPAYSYQPISYHSGTNCGCQSGNTTAWQAQTAPQFFTPQPFMSQSSTPRFSTQSGFPTNQSAVNSQPAGYPISSITSGIPATVISHPRSVQSIQQPMTTQSSQEGWTTIPARVKRTKLSGVINEIPVENIVQPQPYEKRVPPPKDLSYKPQMPYVPSIEMNAAAPVSISNRIAMGPNSQTATASQPILKPPVGSKTFRRETRSYVRAPSAAIVWQTP